MISNQSAGQDHPLSCKGADGEVTPSLKFRLCMSCRRNKTLDFRLSYTAVDVYSVVDASTVNAFKARLDKFWSHQAVKFDFTAVLTGTGNRSEELNKL